jgi:hypothetical protein
MKFYESSADIKATPERIWQLLTDGAGFSDWENGVVRVEGTIAPGETIKVVSEANPDRTFPVKVVEFEPGRRMVWSGGMPLGLFKGVRTFTLDGNGGSTHVHVREEYTGPLLGMIWKSIPDLGPSFEKFTSGLKAKAES